MNTLAPLPVAVPLVAAAIVLGVQSIVPRRAVRALTLAAVVVEIGFAAALVHQAGTTTIVYWFGGWTPRAGAVVGISFTIDQLGAGAALLAGVVTAAAVTTTSSTMPDADGIVYALFLTLLAGMAGFCLTGDLFNMFVFFELMAVSAFAVIAYDTRSLLATRSALNFAVTNSIGAFLVLIGIAVIYSRTGALNLAQIGHQLTREAGPDRAAVLALSLLCAGFLIKAAVVPFHFWLIDTATSAPVPLVMILAGALDTLGVYAVARVYWTVFASPLASEHRAVQAILISIGAFSGVAAGALSLLVRAPRARLAFVMVAHTGILLIGVGCLSAQGVAGAAIYAVGDGTLKVALFIGLALIGFAGGGRQPVSSPSGHARRAGLLILTVGGLATAGLPLFGTGLGKATIEAAATRAGYPWITAVVVVTAAVTGAAVLDIATRARSAARPLPDDVRTGWTSLCAIAALLLSISALTTTAGRWAATSAVRFVDTAAYQQRVLHGATTRLASASGRGTWSTTGLMLDLFTVAAAIVLSAALTRDRARRFATSAQESTPWALVRRFHDGSIGDSATWATLGTASIALVLALSLH